MVMDDYGLFAWGLHPSLCQSSFSGVALQKIWRTYVELFEAWNMQFLPIFFERFRISFFPQRIRFFLEKKFPWENHFRPSETGWAGWAGLRRGSWIRCSNP